MLFPAGLDQEENQRITSTIEKLIKYLDLNNVVFVGGLVARYYISEAGLKYERPINDIDVNFASPENINPDAKNEFKIHHYHKDGAGVYLVLVDPENRIKIDLGDAQNRPVIESTEVEFSGNPQVKLRIPTLEDQFVEYVRDCYRIVNVEGFKNKAHYYADVKMLKQIVDMDKAQKVFEKMDNKNFPDSPAWKDKITSEMPNHISEVYDKAIEFAEEHPEKIIATSYSQSTGPKECEYCAKNDPRFPLTSPQEIFEIMGWDKRV